MAGMSNLVKVLTTAFVAAVVSGEASAEFLTGQKLYQEMQIANKGINTLDATYTTGHAYGYVSAIYDLNLDIAVCPPIGGTAGQMFKIVESYLGNHPETWNLQAAGEVTKALTFTWPCPAK